MYIYINCLANQGIDESTSATGGGSKVLRGGHQGAHTPHPVRGRRGGAGKGRSWLRHPVHGERNTLALTHTRTRKTVTTAVERFFVPVYWKNIYNYL